MFDSSSLATSIVESQVAAFARGDIDGVVEHFTEDCVLTVMAEGPRHGRAAVREYLVELFREMPGGTASMVSVSAAGAEVVAEVDLCARWAGDSLDAATTGGRARVCVQVRTTVVDGRIREEWICLGPAVRAATGGAPPASTGPVTGLGA
jgi:uncharacterized protein (TIGR02246 family)